VAGIETKEKLLQMLGGPQPEQIALASLVETVFATIDAYPATADAVDTLTTLHISGAGVPVDYTDGTPPATGEGVAPKGALYSDITNGFVYRNSGTLAQPIWTKLADAV